MPEPSYTGLLCIGDPHLASRAPGFRRDDYARTILAKLAWSLEYAEQNRLLPVLLGDLFHYPRDNANWMLVELLDLFKTSILAVAGNHDCNENALTADDTLSVLCAAGHVHLLDRSGPWRGPMNGREVFIGGTCWGQHLPECFERDEAAIAADALVIWIAHHDIRFPGYEEAGRFRCREVHGVDIIVNGHIHRPLEDVICGGTTWINPGNIARVSRSDSSRSRRPAVLRIDVSSAGWTKDLIELPHQPFDEVFHPEVLAAELQVNDSLFIRGLAQLESLKTGGAGLLAFLAENLDQFDAPVAAEIRALAEEVIDDG